MRRIVTTLLLILGLLALSAPIESASRERVKASGRKIGTRIVHVKGYTKKNGAKVKAHDRKVSDATPRTTRARDSRGRFVRSADAKRQFMRTSGYPNGRPGYVVDHIRPLACGGDDAPTNMQWQTVAEAKAKDGWERAVCR
jgi:hypothetical protein